MGSQVNPAASCFCILTSAVSGNYILPARYHPGFSEAVWFENQSCRCNCNA